VFATKHRDCKAALKFLKKTMRRYGRPEIVVTDKLRSYKAAMKVIGNESRQETGRWLNIRAENSHQPIGRRERAMAKFRSVESLLKFVSARASIQNHFNQDRHLNPRDDFKKNRTTPLAEWRQLAAQTWKVTVFRCPFYFILTTPAGRRFEPGTGHQIFSIDTIGYGR